MKIGIKYIIIFLFHICFVSSAQKNKVNVKEEYRNILEEIIIPQDAEIYFVFYLTSSNTPENSLCLFKVDNRCFLEIQNFATNQWQEMINRFRLDDYVINNFTNKSTIEVSDSFLTAFYDEMLHNEIRDNVDKDDRSTFCSQENRRYHNLSVDDKNNGFSFLINKKGEVKNSKITNDRIVDFCVKIISLIRNDDFDEVKVYDDLQELP